MTRRAEDAEPGLKSAAADGLIGATSDRDDDDDDEMVSTAGGMVRGVELVARTCMAEESATRTGVDVCESFAAAAMAGRATTDFRIGSLRENADGVGTIDKTTEARGVIVEGGSAAFEESRTIGFTSGFVTDRALGASSIECTFAA